MVFAGGIEPLRSNRPIWLKFLEMDYILGFNNYNQHLTTNDAAAYAFGMAGAEFFNEKTRGLI